MKKAGYKVAAIIAVIFNTLGAESKFVDFEDNLHPAITRITEVVIPEFPCAFNGSIIRWNDRILFSFRERDAQLKSTFRMGGVYLDDNFTPISTPHIFDWQDKNSSVFDQMQDPRLFVVKGKLYIIFSNFTMVGEVKTRRMFVGQLIEQNERFVIQDPVCIDSPDIFNKRLEKNWVPIVYNDELFLGYSISPHYLLKPDLATGKIMDDSWSNVSFDWQWGELRGGTPAVRDGDSYIAFFHSSLLMKSAHSQGKKIQHYVMGAYRFQAEPPFYITDISTEPIVGSGFYHGKAYPTWKPLHVVFAMGCIVGTDSIWVSYGRQDFESWVVEFDKKKLYELLRKTESYTDKKALPVKMYQYSVEGNRE